MQYLSLREVVGDRVEETPIFFLDRKYLTFGRHSHCDYRLLPKRDPQQNVSLSRIQATVERDGDRIVLHRGSIAQAPIEGVKPGASESPFYIGGQPTKDDRIEMALRSEICIYKDAQASVYLKVLDESDPSAPGDTQPFDLLESLKFDISGVKDSIAQMMAMIEALASADREVKGQIKAQDAYITRLKRLGLIGFAVIAIASGGQLVKTDAGKDHFYRVFELMVTVFSSGGIGILAKDSLDKKQH